ncbi:hypothetical protein BDV35DRAFT_352994 [Aspergillus flavus]|uniref:Uncharacterized protein n=1 Tax=Aspergillus flavus TaxID=5059 RepID=A0A5N6GY99_ASPFL|nr:hypothetical protein BDV35DRAFT_352994 [Aspergillus flavus]
MGLRAVECIRLVYLGVTCQGYGIVMSLYAVWSRASGNATVWNVLVNTPQKPLSTS